MAVSLTSAQAYSETALKYGDNVQRVVIQKAGHIEAFVPTTPAYPIVRKAALACAVSSQH